MRTSSATVDVGIPTFGQAPHLRDAIESVLAQSLEDWRLVISEDGSTGDLGRSLEPYLQDERVRLVQQPGQLGAAGNSNALVAHGTAPFVAILHHDDVWEPKFLERRVAFLRGHPDCGFAFGGSKLIDDEGNETGRTTPALTPGCHAPSDYVPLLLERHAVPLPPSIVVRRIAYEAIGTAFDERYPGYDYDTWIRLVVRFPVGYLDEWDSSFRVHPEQFTFRERWHDQHVVFADALAELLNTHLPELRYGEREHRGRRSRAFLSAALDAVETGQRRRSLRLLRSGIREDRRALVNPRLPAVLFTFLVGAQARPALTRARTLVRRRNYLRTHAPPHRQ